MAGPRRCSMHCRAAAHLAGGSGYRSAARLIAAPLASVILISATARVGQRSATARAAQTSTASSPASRLVAMARLRASRAASDSNSAAWTGSGAGFCPW